MSTIDFRPWTSLTQRLKARRAAERGDTRHAHERAIAGDLDGAAAQHPPAASTAPAPAFPATNRAEVVSVDDCLTPAQSAVLKGELIDGNGCIGGVGYLEYRRRYVRQPECRLMRTRDIAPVHFQPTGCRTSVPATPTADHAERFIWWEGSTQ